jgi:hypothetical protein
VGGHGHDAGAPIAGVHGRHRSARHWLRARDAVDDGADDGRLRRRRLRCRHGRAPRAGGDVRDGAASGDDGGVCLDFPATGDRLSGDGAAGAPDETPEGQRRPRRRGSRSPSCATVSSNSRSIGAELTTMPSWALTMAFPGPTGGTVPLSST